MSRVRQHLEATMSRYEVEIVGVETIVVEATDSLAADKTARRQTDAESPLTTDISEVSE
jgi:isocitrate lyase